MKRVSASVAAALLPLLFNPLGSGRLSILIYHRVMPSRDPMRPDEPTVEQFDVQMRLLRRNFTPLSLLEAVDRLAQGTLPRRAVCVTFDDGYSDNEQLALPILKRYGIPASVFVSTGFLNGGRMWNDTVIESVRNHAQDTLDLTHFGLEHYSLVSIDERRDAAQRILSQIKHQEPEQRAAIVEDISGRASDLPNDLMLTDEQVRSLAQGGVAIGAHTISHPILGSVSLDEARREISGSKEHLQEVLQQDVDIFAYPNGRPELDYRPEHRDLVQSLGFRAAVSTHWGVAARESDPYQLPRFTPWDRDELRFTLRLLLNLRCIDPLVFAAA